MAARGVQLCRTCAAVPLLLLRQLAPPPAAVGSHGWLTWGNKYCPRPAAVCCHCLQAAEYLRQFKSEEYFPVKVQVRRWGGMVRGGVRGMLRRRRREGVLPGQGAGTRSCRREDLLMELFYPSLFAHCSRDVEGFKEQGMGGALWEAWEEACWARSARRAVSMAPATLAWCLPAFSPPPPLPHSPHHPPTHPDPADVDRLPAAGLPQVRAHPPRSRGAGARLF